MLNKLFSSRKTLKVDLCFPGDNNKLSIVKNKILWETFFPLHKETGQELNFMMTKFRIHVALIQIVLPPDLTSALYSLCLHGS